MEIKLFVEKGSSQPKTFRMNKPTMVIGRLQGCALRIPSASVSRAHCRLTYAEGVLTVKDLGSANGTFVNGALVKQATLKPGDHLSVGPVTFRVDYPLTPAAVDRLLSEEEGLVPLEAAESVFDAIPLDESAGEIATIDASAPAPSEPAPASFADNPEAAFAALEELAEPAEETPKKRKKKKKKRAEEDEPSPDYSAIVDETGAWQAPAGENIRDLLSQLEDEE